MAQTQKRGGPYTKSEQEERRKKVYKLHFEQGYSAIKISEMLSVNRNTINEDIKKIYEEMAEELPEKAGHLLLKQVQRLEAQRARLCEQLENENEFGKKMMIERMLFSIDSKISIPYQRLALDRDYMYKKIRGNGFPFKFNNMF